MCRREKRKNLMVCKEKNEDFSLWLHFHQHSRKKNQNITYIFLNHSVNERNKFSWLWKTICFNGRNYMKKSKCFLAKSESKGSELSGVVNLLEVDMIVMESFIVMSVYQLQIVVNVIKSLSDVHPYLSHISVLKRSVSQHRYLYTYRFTSLCNFFFVVSYLL